MSISEDENSVNSECSIKKYEISIRIKAIFLQLKTRNKNVLSKCFYWNLLHWELEEEFLCFSKYLM
jgi:hypothetical protein